MVHVISPDDLSKIKKNTDSLSQRLQKADIKNWLVKKKNNCVSQFRLHQGMVKFTFSLFLLLGRVPLKARRCNKNSIWLFVLHHLQGMRRGREGGKGGV